MKRIPLGKSGLFALVDDEDYDDLSRFKWYKYKNPNRSTIYAVRKFKLDEKYKSEYMHKRLTGFNQTDHINGDGLDNQRQNLRSCSNSQNRANTPKQKNAKTSVYKGVYWHKGDQKWMVRIQVNYKSIYLGSFEDEMQAARAYDAAAVLHFGEFARCNFD